MGRVFEASLGDLKANAEDDAYRKFKLRVEEVQGTNCLTNFYGMDLSTDKLRSLVRKWHSLIEAYADVKTTDGYLLRMYCIGFTKRRPNQVRLHTTQHHAHGVTGTSIGADIRLSDGSKQPRAGEECSSCSFSSLLVLFVCLPTDQEDLVCSVRPGAQHPPQDGRDHDPRGIHRGPQRPRRQAHP